MAPDTKPVSKPATIAYDADALHQRLVAALGVTPVIIFSGATGVGKSTVLASAPVPKGKERRVLDHEDSMPFLDAGPQGADLYTPAHQKFRMNRTAFPKLEDYGKLFAALKAPQNTIGVVGVDNIKLLQDQMVEAMIYHSAKPKDLRDFMAQFDSRLAVPNIDRRVQAWQNQTDAAFWDASKAPFKQLLLLCKRQHVMFLGSTEEGNVWENYGQQGQRVIGKKGKMLDVWVRYADAIIFLKRDVNKREAPTGMVNPAQPKMRIQGLNPTWPMDWPSFIAELEAAKKRTDEAIPDEAKVRVDVTSEEPETPANKQQQQ